MVSLLRAWVKGVPKKGFKNRLTLVGKSAIIAMRDHPLTHAVFYILNGALATNIKNGNCFFDWGKTASHSFDFKKIFVL